MKADFRMEAYLDILLFLGLDSEYPLRDNVNIVFG
jgi:hypothetical protein